MSSTNEPELHENVVRIDRHAQSWNGVTVIDVHEYTRGEVLHPLVNEEETGIAMALEEVGGITEPRLKPGQICTLEHRPNHMTLVPKGMPLWGFATRDLHYSRYAVLLFDLAKLEQRFEEDFDIRMFEAPRLRFADPRIHALVRMLIDTPQSEASSLLLGDSLAAATFSLLSVPGSEEPMERGKLPGNQLALVTDYIRDQLPRQIELKELSELVGLSQWHFCRAFKATTGLSPYQWQLDQRVVQVRHLLLQSKAPLDIIAKTTGFGDVMHMIRVFKKRTGETPGAWRRDRR